MSYRVALAVDQTLEYLEHFGHAGHFAIYEFSSGQTVSHGLREAEAFCQREGKQQRLESVTDMLSDCDAVIAVAIGPCARQELKGCDVEMFEFDGRLEDAVKIIHRYANSNAQSQSRESRSSR